MSEVKTHSRLPAGPPPLFQPSNEGTISLVDATLRKRESLFQWIEEWPEGANQAVRMAKLAFIFTAAFGASIGVGHSLKLTAAGAVGLPILLASTTMITLPLLYVYHVYYGSRIHFSQMLSIVCVSALSSSIILAGFTPVMLVFHAALDDPKIVGALALVILGNAGFHGMVAFFKGVAYLDRDNKDYLGLRVLIILAWSTLYALVFGLMAQLLARAFGL